MVLFDFANSHSLLLSWCIFAQKCKKRQFIKICHTTAANPPRSNTTKINQTIIHTFCCFTSKNKLSIFLNLKISTERKIFFGSRSRLNAYKCCKQKREAKNGRKKSLKKNPSMLHRHQ